MNSLEVHKHLEKEHIPFWKKASISQIKILKSEQTIKTHTSVAISTYELKPQATVSHTLGRIKFKILNQVLVRLCSKWNPHELLMKKYNIKIA